MKFLETFRVNLDKDKRVMVGGKAGHLVQADLEIGIARIDGFWRSPNYFKAYLHAASLLIKNGHETGSLDEIGFPGFYLQRHATELTQATTELPGRYRRDAKTIGYSNTRSSQRFAGCARKP